MAAETPFRSALRTQASTPRRRHCGRSSLRARAPGDPLLRAVGPSADHAAGFRLFLRPGLLHAAGGPVGHARPAAQVVLAYSESFPGVPRREAAGRHHEYPDRRHQGGQRHDRSGACGRDHEQPVAGRDDRRDVRDRLAILPARSKRCAFAFVGGLPFHAKHQAGLARRSETRGSGGLGGSGSAFVHSRSAGVHTRGLRTDALRKEKRRAGARRHSRQNPAGPAQGEGRGPGGGGHGRGALVRHAPRAEWNPDAGRAAGVFGIPEPHV